MIRLCAGCRFQVRVLNNKGGLSRCAYTCEGPGEHGWLTAFTDAELRARDEAIIKATLVDVGSIYDDEYPLPKKRVDAIIDAAEQETP